MQLICNTCPNNLVGFNGKKSIKTPIIQGECLAQKAVSVTKPINTSKALKKVFKALVDSIFS